GNQWSGRSSMMPRKKLKALRNYSMRFQQVTPGSTSREDKEPSGVDPRSYSRDAEFLKFQQNLKERGQTNFMMIWRRPKQRMPTF
ncbi:hypothetical protein Dimus_013378, partial [Dionaea muscipula]